MGRYLITQSLLSSWNYLFACWEGQEGGALAEFVRALRRERAEQTEAMLNGAAFEREVYMMAAGQPRSRHKRWEQGITAAAAVIMGAQTQVKLSRDIEVSGRKFLLYGILDALKAGVIYDVKFTNKTLASGSSTYEFGKYRESAQHPAYFRLAPEAYEFQYLTSDGEDLCTEKYRRGETRPIEGIVAEFMASINSMGLMPAYLENWAAL